MKHWHITERDPTLSILWPEAPIVAYKKNKNLKDSLVRAKLQTPISQLTTQNITFTNNSLTATQVNSSNNLPVIHKWAWLWLSNPWACSHPPERTPPILHSQQNIWWITTPKDNCVHHRSMNTKETRTIYLQDNWDYQPTTPQQILSLTTTPYQILETNLETLGPDLDTVLRNCRRHASLTLYSFVNIAPGNCYIHHHLVRYDTSVIILMQIVNLRLYNTYLLLL